MTIQPCYVLSHNYNNSIADSCTKIQADVRFIEGEDSTEPQGESRTVVNRNQTNR